MERLKIQKINLWIIDGGQEKQVKFSHKQQGNLLHLKMDDGFTIGKTYLLKLNYMGKLSKSKHKGVFYETYKLIDGTKR